MDCSNASSMIATSCPLSSHCLVSFNVSGTNRPLQQIPQPLHANRMLLFCISLLACMFDFPQKQPPPAYSAGRS